MANESRDGRSRFDHVGDRPGEIPEDLSDEADLFFNQRVGAVYGEALTRLNAAQTAFGLSRELSEDLVEGHLLEIDADL